MYRDANQQFINCFSEDQGLVYCNDIDMLFTLFEYPHDPNNWRLFIDSSASALKAVLLHNGNIEPTVPIAYSTSMSETYEAMEILLEKIQYRKYKWQICADFKVVGILMGLQAGNTKYPCHLCLWDSRARKQHYKRSAWPSRPKQSTQQQATGEDEHTEGEPTTSETLQKSHNVLKTNLVDPGAIIFPPLHIMLGLMTQFFKTLVKRAKMREKQKKSDEAKKKAEEEESEEEEQEEDEDDHEEEREVC